VFLGSKSTGSEFSIAVFALALPKLAPGSAGCVPIVGGGSKSFLFLVVLDERELDWNREEEEYGCDNSDGEADGIEPARHVERWKFGETTFSIGYGVIHSRVSISKGSANVAAAGVTVTCSVGNICECTSEGNVEDYANH